MRSFQTLLFYFGILLTTAATLWAQPAQSPDMVAAAGLMKQQKYADAAASLELIVKADPANAAAWYQLGTARYWLKDYSHSAAAFERSATTGNNPFAMYNLAAVDSLLGDKEAAFKWLNAAISNPKMPLALIDFNDKDLDAIRSDPRFTAIRDQVDRAVHPCMYREDAKKFDFWVGDWDVFDTAGTKMGTSSVQSFASGCGILENWRGRTGLDGKSINFFDTADSRWFQYWMGPNGAPLRYKGVFRDAAIRYEGEQTGSDGKVTMLRLTFFDIDPMTVRQLAETSSDGGRSWVVSYDYKYVRRK